MSQYSENYFEGKIYQKLILYATIAFLVLPFITSFNELLTKVVENLNYVKVIQRTVAPFVVKILAGILRSIDVPVTIYGPHLYLTGGWIPMKIYISWNCIGWQGFILFALTIITGLQGKYTLTSKLITIIIGLEGTFLVNIVRILVPTLLAYYVGYIPAIIFHNYFGTIITLMWIAAFWSYAFGNILEKKKEKNIIQELSGDSLIIMGNGVAEKFNQNFERSER